MDTSTAEKGIYKTALITGASDGIGRELARLFAADGHRLVLVSRNEEKLTKLARELTRYGAPDVMVIAADLTRENSAAEVYNKIKNHNLDINFLVNDAGSGVYGFFNDTDIEKELKLVQLNICSMIHLTKLCMKEMLARNEGRILQLAALQSYQPTPMQAVYAASKAFVLSFTHAVINELKGTNVTMTALIPGATATNFFENSGMAPSEISVSMLEDPALVAEIGYYGMLHGDHQAMAPGVRSRVLMNSVLPNRTIAAQARKQMENVTGAAGSAR